MLRVAPGVAVALLLLIGGQAFGGTGELPREAVAGRAVENVVWDREVRLTQDGAVDDHPSVFPATGGGFDLSWVRGDGLIMSRRLSENGSALSSETINTVGTPPRQHSGQGTENVVFDGEGRLHAVWMVQDFFRPVYQVFDPGGWTLCQAMSITPNAATAHAASLAVGAGGRAYIAYENELDGRVEMSYVTNSSGFYNLHTGYLAGMWGNGSTIGVDSAGCPHVFYKNATGTGYRHTRFSPDGNVLLDSAFVPDIVGGCGPDSAVPKLAFGPDGAIHVLQASRVSGQKSLYYSKLANDGTRLTDYQLICTGSGDFGDICAGADGTVHIVWEDDYDAQVHYAWILSGKENESISSVRVSNSTAMARNPTVAVSADGDIAVAWTDDRDGNDEVYFREGVRSGIELQRNGEYTTSVHLLQELECPMYLENTGLADLTVKLGLDCDFYDVAGGIGQDYNGTGWKLWLDSGDIRLAPREVISFPVHVRGPASGNNRSYINVVVFANAGLAYPLWAYASFRLQLSLSGGLALECSETEREALPASPAVFNLAVSSFDYAEHVIFELARPADWEAAILPNDLSLGARETRPATLTVTPPGDAGANETATVIVTAATSSNHTARVYATVRVAPVLDIYILADRSEESLPPGEELSVSLEVVKRGNVHDVTDVLLEVNGVPAGWEAVLDANRLKMYLDQVTHVNLMVRAPGDAPAGRAFTLSVLARDLSGAVFDTCGIELSVRVVHDVVLQASEEPLRLFPSERGNAQVHVENRGNGPEELRPGPMILWPGWEAWFERPGGGRLDEGAPLVLDAGDCATLVLAVVPHAKAPTGDYFVIAPLNGTGGAGYDVTVFVFVRQVFGISVAAEIPEASAVPGGEAKLAIVIRNLGNGPDRLELRGEGLPTDFPAPEFFLPDGRSSDAVTIDAFVSVRVRVAVTVPGGCADPAVHFQVEAWSSAGTNGSARLDIRVLHVNVALSDLTVTDRSPRPGETVRFRFLVSNSGDVDIGNVTLTVLDGGRVLVFRELGGLPAGQGWVYDYSWTATAGGHRLRFVVDAVNATEELDRLDNAVEVDLDVGAVGEGGAPPWPVAAVVAAAAVAAVLAILWRRKAAGGRRR